MFHEFAIVFYIHIKGCSKKERICSRTGRDPNGFPYKRILRVTQAAFFFLCYSVVVFYIVFSSPIWLICARTVSAGIRPSVNIFKRHLL